MTQKALLQSAGDGTAIAAGYVGELRQQKTASPLSLSSGSGSFPLWSGGAITLSKGVWLPMINVQGSDTGSVTFTESMRIGFSTDSSTSTWSDLDSTGISNNTTITPQLVLGVGGTFTATNLRIAESSVFSPIQVSADNTIYYVKFHNRISSGTFGFNITFSMVRIA